MSQSKEYFTKEKKLLFDFFLLNTLNKEKA